MTTAPSGYPPAAWFHDSYRTGVRLVRAQYKRQYADQRQILNDESWDAV